ncbi:hypothetical protein D3C87_2006680 [compost metagenome]
MPAFPDCDPLPHADLGERLRADLPGLLKLGAGIYMAALAASNDLKAIAKATSGPVGRI